MRVGSPKLSEGFSVRLAKTITSFSGSMPFFYFHVLFFTTWIALNNSPHTHHWDPYPHGFLTLVVSLEAIFLGTFTLIAQNATQASIDDRERRMSVKIDEVLEILRRSPTQRRPLV